MRLSEHFSLAEACKSQTAERLGIDNTPDQVTIERMKLVCEKVLEPVRTYFARPVTVSSFYRSPRLNAEVGSKPGSQHVTGEAVDFEVPGMPNPDVAEWVQKNLLFDQCILEFHKPDVPDSGWVHVSFRDGACRKECLTVNASGTKVGIVT